jgi:hypothetical protein
VPPETLALHEHGYGLIVWTPEVAGDAGASVTAMRRQMLSDRQFDAGLLVGGMEGILAEAEVFEALQPGRPLLPVRAPGGAAREVSPPEHELVDRLRDDLASERYPLLAQRLVRALADSSLAP